MQTNIIGKPLRKGWLLQYKQLRVLAHLQLLILQKIFCYVELANDVCLYPRTPRERR